MENKNGIFVMFLVTLVFAGILFAGLSKVDPSKAVWTGFLYVTSALVLFFWGLIGTIMLAARRIGKSYRPIAVSLRQAGFLAVTVVVALYMQRFDLLTWLNVLALVILVVLIEVFFIGKEETIENQ